MIRSKTVQSSLAELRAARVQYAQALESIDAAILALGRFAEPPQPTKSQNVKRLEALGGAKLPKAQPGIRPREFRRMRYGEAIARVLRRESPQQLSVWQIVEALRGGGRAIKTKNPYKTVYRAMKNSPRFRNSGGKWTLAEPSGNLTATSGQAQGVAAG